MGSQSYTITIMIVMTRACWQTDLCQSSMNRLEGSFARVSRCFFATTCAATVQSLTSCHKTCPATTRLCPANAPHSPSNTFFLSDFACSAALNEKMPKDILLSDFTRKCQKAAPMLDHHHSTLFVMTRWGNVLEKPLMETWSNVSCLAKNLNRSDFGHRLRRFLRDFTIFIFNFTWVVWTMHVGSNLMHDDQNF